LEKVEQESSELSEQEKHKRSMILLEAALYVAGRPLDLKTLASVIRTHSKKRVQNIARELLNLYKSRETALEILELEDERFVLQLKGEYTSEVRRLSLRPLLSAGPLKTLSYIAFRQPLSQAQVIQVRGKHAYGHLKQLEALGLILRERTGKTMTIRSTDYFADYFGLSHEPKTMKLQLQNIFKDITKNASET
jgi:segregation and condensation protein B